MTSELSNALNPRAAQHRTRARQRQTDIGHAPTSVAHHDVAQRTAHSYVPHRSELELAIIPPEQPQVPVPTPTVANRQALNTVQELLQAVVTQNAAVQAERARRRAWEQEQEARRVQREVELQSQLEQMKSELQLLKASVSIQKQPSQPLLDERFHEETFQPPLPEPAAYIEEITTPTLQDQHIPRSEATEASSTSNHLAPAFVEGSSSIPLPIPGASNRDMHDLSAQDGSFNRMLPSPTLTDATTDPTVSSPVPPRHAQPHVPSASSSADSPSHLQLSPPLETPPVGLPSPAQSSTYTSPIMPTTRPQTPSSRALGKRRTPPSPASDYSSEDSETEPPSGQSEAPRKRKNGHDRRCLTIQHAMRVHLLKCMRLRSNEALPQSYDESRSLAPDEPVRFVWEKTVKKSPHNAAMKKRILRDFVARRKRYKDVPDKDFDKTVLDAVFEQSFLTLRQKFKLQKDDSSAIQYKLREDQKYMKSRRKDRKKTKLAKRTEQRKKLGMFAHSTFDPALLLECMSSDESCDEHVEEVYPTSERSKVQLFITRGPTWRSSRLVRFYSLLDAEDVAEQLQLGSASVFASNKHRRPLPRKERRVGPPKDGLIMPPQGVASWMISRRWVKETSETHPDLEGVLEGLVEDSPGFDWGGFDVLGEESEEEGEQEVEEEEFIPRSDTSYSLAHALAPPM
ncbi:hypothetical protein BDY19DRAFT_944941 [Irpex rosettiformis]|uniref:Uncharacterized protein n=1 Tax=Irpex rosettiformis TaxID=378272 RepID=A0ACB8U4M1_9APHY|nr:hypothetical protein BDY19DRAFT_944941 [Irpex rosettiformis]